MTLPNNFVDESLHQSGIYMITCVESGKVYIGSAVDLFTRWRQHFYHLTKNKHHCRHLQNAWNKYGANDFKFAVLEFTPADELREREQAFIDFVKPEDRFNATPTAGSLLGFKMNAESLERMRVAHTGFRHSEETKRRVSAARAGIAPRPAGWKMPEEGRAKVSAARKGKALSPEHRAKCVELLRNAKHGPRTAEHRKQIFEASRMLTDEQVISARLRYVSGESMESIADSIGCSRRSVNRAIRGHGHYGKIGEPVTEKKRRVVSEEQRQKISAAQKGKPKSEEARKNIAAGIRARFSKER